MCVYFVHLYCGSGTFVICFGLLLIFTARTAVESTSCNKLAMRTQEISSIAATAMLDLATSIKVVLAF